MLIKKVKYSQFEEQDKKWSLNEVDFGKINLLVGKNSSGKSKTLAIVNSLSRLLTEHTKLPFVDGSYSVTFDSHGSEYVYELKFRDFTVILERLLIDGKLFLERDADGGGEILTYGKRYKVPIPYEDLAKLEFKIPSDELKANRRDEIQYPYLEDLNFWAKHVRHFEFGSTLGKEELQMRNKLSSNTEIELDFNLKRTRALIATFLNGRNKHGQKFVDKVVADFNTIGFNITNVDVGSLTTVSIIGNNPGLELLGLIVKENDLECVTDQSDMSYGMYRTLSIIVHFVYYELEEIPGTILIDDIGEGLDFERAANLIQLLISKIELTNQSIQLIMSTNDRFIMNFVDLKYWQIIERTGSNVKYYNSRNSAKTFDDFKFTGRNNFDLFASGFFKNGFDSKK